MLETFKSQDLSAFSCEQGIFAEHLQNPCSCHRQTLTSSGQCIHVPGTPEARMHIETGDVGLDRVVAWYFNLLLSVCLASHCPHPLQEATASSR
jgi:hypothetical protein